MSVEVRVPALPESVADATLVSWHKKPGDPVKRDENLVDLETDKVVLEMPAPTDGVMGEILRGDGETVTTGDVIATISEGGTAEATQAEAPAAKAQPEPQAAKPQTAPTNREPEAPTAAVDLEALSPAVRRLVAEHKLDVSQIRGTGKGGRITKADVLDFIETGGTGGEVAAKTGPATGAPAPVSAGQAAPAQPAAPAAKPAAPIAPDKAGRTEQRVAMTRLRARIAERLLEAKNSTAMLTTFNEVNMKPVMELRARYKDKFEKDHGVRLGFMSFFVKAAVEALKKYPAVNASIDGNDIIYHGYYDIGIAVSSPRGLVVPILRDADQMSLADIEKTIGDFGKRAKEGTLGIDEMSGGTFTITNGGVFGSLMSTPILNP
ncbi:MAG: 2-oxoglutarate dehydrogenase complex dihydrolipoyllysine-residue succinyltransferase, partial [Candidatus Competibacteraceae bacterium]|nr:2-oxoglutarate dehydrogenase complex dihydrolipoyllysine-residue succinyltransferase [Candidatus Competibacteraceae bacterium]